MSIDDSAGGTYPSQRQNILKDNAPVTSEKTSDSDVVQGVADGKGVVTNHDVSKLYNDPTDSGGHVVVATGVEYNDDGTVKNVLINDTGKGGCSVPYPAGQYFGSRTPTVNMTKAPVVKT